MCSESRKLLLLFLMVSLWKDFFVNVTLDRTWRTFTVILPQKGFVFRLTKWPDSLVYLPMSSNK